jgi:hypothetical protein
MPDQDAPRVESAKYVIPFEADTSEVEAALDRLDRRAVEVAENMARKFSDAMRDDRASPSVMDAVAPAFERADAPGDDGERGGEIVEAVRRNTDALNEVRDALEGLAEAIAATMLSGEL